VAEKVDEPPGIVTSSCTERDYIIDGLEKYLADNNMRLEELY
jgi:hypothetical protein